LTIWNLATLAAIISTGFADPQDRTPKLRPAAIPDQISYAGTGNG
jgi:hypothetical protein